jgi:hypothetical protein
MSRVPILRAILAPFIALSLVVLPAAGGMAGAAQPEQAAEMSMAMSSSAPMDDCCQKLDDSADLAGAKCGSMAACGSMCFAAGALAPSMPLVYPWMLAVTLPAPNSSAVQALMGGPPFRPPRI